MTSSVAEPWIPVIPGNVPTQGTIEKTAEGMSTDSAYIEARALTLWRSESVDGLYFAPAVAGYVTAQQGYYFLDSTAYTFTSGGIQYSFATLEGEMYRLDFWVLTAPKSSNLGTGIIDVFMDGYQIGSFVVEGRGSTWTWQQFSLDFTAENVTTYIEFQNSPNPSLHFVDMEKILVGNPVWEFSEVPEPSTVWLLAAGVVMLAGLRYSRFGSGYDDRR